MIELDAGMVWDGLAATLHGHQQDGRQKPRKFQLFQQQQKFLGVLNYQKSLKQMLIELGDKIVMIVTGSKAALPLDLIHPQPLEKE